MFNRIFRRSLLRVPEEFNRNSAKISAFMAAEKSGRWLLERLQRQLGLASLASIRMLDFGCGVRFAQAILNERLAIGEYAGIDCFAPMIEFLQREVSDPRLSFHLLEARHALYNPAGTPLSDTTRLPLPEQHYDVACMYSVITHQYPDDARAIFAMLRRHVRPTGRLFFTCFLDDAIERFEDRSPERNGGFCFYAPSFLERLVAESGWIVEMRYPGEPPLIGDSYLCRPA